MLLGLEDFDVEMFLTFDDKNIFIYYSDFETIPGLVDLVPLGSFDDETESFLWVNLDYLIRLQTSLLFMERDLYAYEDPNTKEILINRELDPDEPHFDKAAFMTEFYNIPEVVFFFDKYKNICKNYNTLYEAPEEWIGWDKAEDLGWWFENNGVRYIDWNNYPNWCQTCAEYTYDDPPAGDPIPKCAYSIPIEVIPPKDLYFIAIVYFNGIYRTNPESIQDFGLYEMLTDIDFEQNKYTMVIDVKKFFTNEFQWFLQTTPGMMPFGCDYGTGIKYAVQTKDSSIRRIEVQNEINFFIHNFNQIYGGLVQVENIEITARDSDTGGNAWLIEVQATIMQERLIYRIEARE